jgi:serine/threonine protein kinase
MDYFPKGDLERWMKKHPDRSKLENGSILFHIGCALEIFHSNRVIHRDLKPQNILMDDNDLPILTDFDVCKDERAEHHHSTFHSTATSFVGTQAYMDPAVLFKKADVNFSSDLYSLGVIAGELILNRTLSPLDSIPSKDIDPEAKALLEGLLCTEQSQRWTLKQFLESPYVKGIQRCIICLENHVFDEIIGCNPGKKHTQNHYMCRASFETLVSSFCSQDVKQLAGSGALLKCPEPTCLRYYSDVCIAKYAPNQIKEYVAAKLKMEELKMSNKMKQELERLQKLNAEQREAELIIKQIVDGILSLNCPRCGQVFVDFDGCFALTCSRCGCGFCAWCFKDCGKNAHNHVANCSSNLTPKRAVFGDMSICRESNRTRVKSQVQQKLNSITSSEVKKIVLKSLEHQLQDIGIHPTAQ